MKKTFKGALAFVFCVVTVFATMLVASAISAPKAKVKTITYNSVTISWSAVSGADGYQVQRSTDGKKWTTLTSSTKSTSYKDSKLTTGRTYRYRVRAFDKAFLRTTYSSWSQVSAKPVPAKVTGLKATQNYNSVKLSWTKVSGASGYVVQRYSGGKWSTYKTTTKTAMTVSKLTLGKTYNFRVRAYRTVSGSKKYGAYSSTLKTGPALKAPSSFVLKGVTTSTLSLSWSAVEGAKGYEVYNTVTKKWTNTKTKRTLTVKSLKSGTKYGFIVRAYSGSYDGKKTSTRYFVTTPTAPKNVKVSEVKTTSFKISWSAVTSNVKYQASIYDPSTKAWKNLKETDKTYITATGLKAGTKYTVKVRAFAKNSNVKDISATTYSSWSTTVESYTAPAAPKTITLTKATGTSLSISWTASSGATGYEYLNPVTGAWVSTGTTRATEITGLEEGTKYTLKVRAVLNSLKSADSSAFAFITAPAAPDDFTNVSATDGKTTVNNSTTDSITVTWNSTQGAVNYQVQYSTDGSSWTSLNETTATVATIKGLDAAKEYKVRVRAYSKNSSTKTYGEYSYADARTLATDTTTLSYTSSDKTLNFSWTAVANATGYTVEKFEAGNKVWKIYDFKYNRWALPKDISESNIIATTETSLAYTESVNKADIYRVRAVDANGYAGTPSNVINASTADVTITDNNGAVTIKWPAVAGATSYRIHNLYPETQAIAELAINELNPSNGYLTAKLYLAPNSTHSIMLYAVGATSSMTFTFNTGNLDTGSGDQARNGQLLYLARAINNTKEYQGLITIRNDATISYAINELHIKMPFPFTDTNLYSPEEIEEYFKSQGEEGMTARSEENYTEQKTYYKSVSTDGASDRLRYAIEPSSGSMIYANLPNGHVNASAWKNGFDSSKISATKNTDGGYTIKATLKAEGKSPVYHNGFVSTFASAGFGSIEGFDVTEVVVGPTSLEAVISADGILKSYKVKSPYSTTIAASFSGEGAGSDLLDALLSMSMTMGGSTDYTYTITK